jgi:hypothetical protein
MTDWEIIAIFFTYMGFLIVTPAIIIDLIKWTNQDG